MWRASAVLIVVVGAGCADGDALPSNTTNSESTTNPECHWGPEWTTSAGGGWSTDFVGQQYGYRAQTQFAVTPQPSATGPIDAVVGYSQGPATKFSDLGAIVRFNPDGKIDARDGSTYRAVNDYPYATDGTQYVVHFTFDFDRHTYSAEVGPYSTQWVPIATDFAFRTEQATMSRVDNFGRFIDSDSGGLLICDYAESAQAHDTRADSGWVTTPLLAQSGHVKVDVTVFPTQVLDGVVGLASTTPTKFSDLAAIARFSPEGIVDVRDGGSYRADARFEYVPAGNYNVIFDVNIPAKTYDVDVYELAADRRTRIATGYHFRTEQAGATSLSALGQFVDGTPGLLSTSHLIEIY